MCVCVSVCVYAAFVNLRKPFEIETQFFPKLHGIAQDIICKSLHKSDYNCHDGEQKMRPENTINGYNSAINNIENSFIGEMQRIAFRLMVS